MKRRPFISRIVNENKYKFNLENWGKTNKWKPPKTRRKHVYAKINTSNKFESRRLIARKNVFYVICTVWQRVALERTMVSKCLVIIWLMRAFQHCLRWIHCVHGCTCVVLLQPEMKGTSSKNYSKFPAKKYKNVVKLNQSRDISIIHLGYKCWHVHVFTALYFTFVRFQINLKQTWVFVKQEIKIKITTSKWFFYRIQCALIFQNESAAASSANLVCAMHART